MESIKSCNVCYLSYDTKDYAPRSLSCGHTVCSNCLTNLLNNPILRKCPFDNIAFMISQNSLANFPLNFVLLDLLEQKNNNTCKTHVGERLKLMCLTDKTKICSECAKHEDHKDHKIKKIKALKAQGAKVKRELQETLSSMRDYEKEKTEDFEQIRKVFINAIDEQVKEVKNILVEKQFEWVQQVNNIFDADKKRDSEGLFAFKQQIDETIKDITHACQDENGDLLILEKEANNHNQDVAKRRTELLKEKSSRVQGKILEMQKSLKEAFVNSKTVINFLCLASQDVIEEIYTVTGEQERLSQDELTKLHQKLGSIKFMSHCEIKMDSGCLNISFKHGQQKELEINLDDFQVIEKVNLKLVRCDMLKGEPHLDVLSYIFRGLKNLDDLTVSFDPQNFNNEGLLWLGSTIQNHVDNLKSFELDLAKCKLDSKSLQIICDMILFKVNNLDSFAINLDSCQILDADLITLAKSIQPMHKNLEFFALGVNKNKITDDGIHQIFEVVKKMEALKGLELNLSSTNISNESFKVFGESVLPCLKELEYLPLFLTSSRILDEGLCAIMKNLPNLKGLNLRLSKTLLTDKAMEMFIGEVLPRLESLEYLSFRAEETQVSRVNLQKIQVISAALEKKSNRN